jgi:hypothetical protein
MAAWLGPWEMAFLPPLPPPLEAGQLLIPSPELLVGAEKPPPFRASAYRPMARHPQPKMRGANLVELPSADQRVVLLWSLADQTELEQPKRQTL